MIYLYILKCQDNSYYVGITHNLENRINEHSLGMAHYTKSRLPIELVFHKEYKDTEQAATAEKKLKSWSRVKKEKVIRGEWQLSI
jgi:putative endonuclease